MELDLVVDIMAFLKEGLTYDERKTIKEESNYQSQIKEDGYNIENCYR